MLNQLSTLNFNNCFLHMQYTNCGTDEDAVNDAYIQLGNVSSVDLVSFAYQIASGMVRKFMNLQFSTCIILC